MHREQCLASKKVDPLHGLEMYWFLAQEAHSVHSVVSYQVALDRKHRFKMYLPIPHPDCLQGLHAEASLSSYVAVPLHNTLGSMYKSSAGHEEAQGAQSTEFLVPVPSQMDVMYCPALPMESQIHTRVES
jgi:hypothetical protein